MDIEEVEAIVAEFAEDGNDDQWRHAALVIVAALAVSARVAALHEFLGGRVPMGDLLATAQHLHASLIWDGLDTLRYEWLDEFWPDGEDQNEARGIVGFNLDVLVALGHVEKSVDGYRKAAVTDG